MKLQNNQLRPFQGIMGGDYILINFGVVFGSGNDSGPEPSGENEEDNEVGSVFVPKINGKFIVRDYESGYEERNSLFVGSNPTDKIICLKVNLENIENKFEEVTKIWKKEFTEKDTSSIEERMSRQYSKQSLYIKLIGRNYNSNGDRLTWGSSVSDIDWDNRYFYFNEVLFDPVVNMTPKIKSVDIVTLNDQPDDDSREATRNIIPFIQEDSGNYFKYVPIIHIDSNGNLEQLLDQDYVFVCPFTWLDSIKEG